MKIYLRAAVRYLIFYTLAFAAFMLLEMLLHNLYSILSLYYPDAVPIYDELSTPEKYARLSEIIATLSAILSVIIASFISTVLDNERFEYLITRTDGFYKVADGTRLYLKRYALPDAIASATAPLPIFALGLISLPERPRGLIRFFIEAFSNLLSLTNAITDSLGLIFGLSATILTAFISKLLFSPYAALRYRARWLSNI